MILTDSCNFRCTYCYKTKQDYTEVVRKMDRKVAADAVNWLMDMEIWDPSDSKSVINLWGGEPSSNYEMIEFFLTEYPQIHYRMNTNGALINKDRAQFLVDHRYHLTLTISLGSAYENYGGVDQAIKKLWPLAERIIESNGAWGVNFVVMHPENLYEDIKIMKGYGFQDILIDIPRFTEISDEYTEHFIENYQRIAEEFKLKDKRGTEQGMKYCGSGIERILIDPSGDVYPCDGFYGIRFKKLGNIYEKFDMSVFDFFKDLKQDVARFYEKCKDCETQCWFERCMTANIIKNGDMFNPDPNWCKIRKVFKQLRNGEVYV